MPSSVNNILSKLVSSAAGNVTTSTSSFATGFSRPSNPQQPSANAVAPLPLPPLPSKGCNRLRPLEEGEGEGNRVRRSSNKQRRGRKSGCRSHANSGQVFQDQRLPAAARRRSCRPHGNGGGDGRGPGAPGATLGSGDGERRKQRRGRGRGRGHWEHVSCQSPARYQVRVVDKHVYVPTYIHVLIFDSDFLSRALY